MPKAPKTTTPAEAAPSIDIDTYTFADANASTGPVSEVTDDDDEPMDADGTAGEESGQDEDQDEDEDKAEDDEPAEIDPQRYAVMDSYYTAFEDPRYAGLALRDLASKIAAEHGTTVEALLGVSQPQPAKQAEQPAPIEENDEFNYEFETDRDLAKHVEARAVARATAQFQARIDALEQKLQVVDSLADERRQLEERRQVEKRAVALVPSVEQRIQKLNPGWKVTREDLGAAMVEFPGLPPAKAYEAKFSERLRRHAAGVGRHSAPKGPEAIRPTGAPGSPIDLDLDNFDFAAASRRAARQQQR